MSTPLCDNCGEKPASVFITKVINQESSHHSYCEGCAREKAMGEGWLAHLTQQLGDEAGELEEQIKEVLGDLPLDEVMSGLFEGVNLGPQHEDSFVEEGFQGGSTLEESDLLPLDASGNLPARCPSCGTTWDRLKQDGRAGCSACYEEFKPQLDEVMTRLQFGPRHFGKAPFAAAKRRQRLEHLRQRRDNQLTVLQLRLKDAVSAERYEEAAKLRDKIKIVSSTIVS